MAPGNTGEPADLMAALVAGGAAAVSPNGVLGDPRAASTANGELMLAEMVHHLRERLGRRRPDSRGPLG
jgi:creatinine amidohydrolase